MAVLGQPITPGLSKHRSEEAQGANVGDYAYDSAGNYYRWDGVSWAREGGGSAGDGGTP